MKAAQKDRALYLSIASKMPPDTAPMDLNTAHALRRAQLTLHRWAEEECNGTIQRREPGATCTQCGHKMYGEHFAQAGTPCEKCGDPAPIRSRPKGPERWVVPEGRAPYCLGLIPDRERGALARIEKVCKAADLHYYHQTDPRGCALYVSAEPLNDQNYSSKGIPCL